MNTVLGIYTSIISVCNMTEDTNKIIVLDKEKANSYDGDSVTVIISEEAALIDYHCKQGL